MSCFKISDFTGCSLKNNLKTSLRLGVKYPDNAGSDLNRSWICACLVGVGAFGMGWATAVGVVESVISGIALGTGIEVDMGVVVVVVRRSAEESSDFHGLVVFKVV